MTKTVLAIGTTGLGKTTMANVLCGAVVDGSSGAESATKEPHIYETAEFRYIDTCGFDDSFGTTEEEVFHDIMRFFQRYREDNVFNIDILLWFCSESEREMDHLRREANFIQHFIEYTDGCKPTDLWENVLIVTKGNCSSQKLVNGPKSAARNACQAFTNIQITADSFLVKNFPCWIYDLDPEDNTRWVEMDPVTRGLFNCYRRDDVKSKIQSLLPDSRPISIQFKQGKCQKCNATGDPRLFANRCHTTPRPGHVPDETSILNLLTDKFGDGSYPKDSITNGSITAELAGIVGVCKSAGRWVINNVPTAGGATTSAAGSVATTSIGSAATTSIGSVIGIAAGASVVLAIFVGGGVAYYCESKDIRCKYCKKFIGEKGCIMICTKCKEVWNKTSGCQTSKT